MRTRIISVRFSGAELRHVAEGARKEGRTISEFLRLHAMAAATSRHDPYDWPTHDEWTAMPKGRRRSRALELVALAHARRSRDMKDGDLTLAERSAMALLESVGA